MIRLFFILLFILPLKADEENETQIESESLRTSAQHFEEGMQLFEKGEYASALESFNLAELEADEMAPIEFNRGLCHLALNEYEKAEEYFGKVLSSQDPEYQMKAHYNLGHLHFLQSLKAPEVVEGQEPSNYPDYDIPKLRSASFAFREVTKMSRQYEGKLSRETLKLVDKAEENIKIIAARYIHYEDRLAKRKGRKTKIIQGNVKVNGRPAPHAFVYIKSKWEDQIHAHMRTDENGKFSFEGLDVGKYQLASVLYDETKAENLNWGEEIKLPTFESDNHDLSIQGAMTLAVPYQTQTPSLETPWDDHLRINGSKSITSSTDWGELNDGRPLETLPEDSDFHQGYVAFDSLNLRMGMAIPTQQQEQAQPGQQIQQSTEPTAPPTYKVTLKGFQDFEDVHFPDYLRVFGMKEGSEEPIELYSSNIQVDEEGLVEWKSEEFVHKDCRQLLFDFQRSKGKRMSFHEIEVYEDTKQENQNQDQQQQDQNQDQQQDQEQNQDQQQQEQPQQQEPQERESRSVRSILQKVKDKNEEAKERQKGTGIILHSDKDY